MEQTKHLEEYIIEHAEVINDLPDVDNDERDICALILMGRTIYEVAEELMTSIDQVLYTVDVVIDKVKNMENISNKGGASCEVSFNK